ncbi:MAG: hypothetical protein Q4C49_01900 [Bacillota bacterium]|nr:hypothetical protein [Bacillota bacterium]
MALVKKIAKVIVKESGVEKKAKSMAFSVALKGAQKVALKKSGSSKVDQFFANAQFENPIMIKWFDDNSTWIVKDTFNFSIENLEQELFTISCKCRNRSVYSMFVSKGDETYCVKEQSYLRIKRYILLDENKKKLASIIQKKNGYVLRSKAMESVELNKDGKFIIQLKECGSLLKEKLSSSDHVLFLDTSLEEKEYLCVLSIIAQLNK